VNGPGDDANATAGTGQPDAGQPTLPDLEDLDGLDLVDPEYVLAYIPPYVSARRVLPGLRSLFPGLWALFTAGEWAADCPPPQARQMHGLRNAPVPFLTTWAQRELGYPVALEPGSVTLKAPHPFARTHHEPLYWVRRNT
jgi:hypothetical protein